MSSHIEPRFKSKPMEKRCEYLRPRDVAQKLGISLEVVKRHLRNKRLPGVKLGRSWLIRASELERLLSAKEALFDARDE